MLGVVAVIVGNLLPVVLWLYAGGNAGAIHDQRPGEILEITKCMDHGDHTDPAAPDSFCPEGGT